MHEPQLIGGSVYRDEPKEIGPGENHRSLRMIRESFVAHPALDIVHDITPEPRLVRGMTSSIWFMDYYDFYFSLV